VGDGHKPIIYTSTIHRSYIRGILLPFNSRKGRVIIIVKFPEPKNTIILASRVEKTIPSYGYVDVMSIKFGENQGFPRPLPKTNDM